MRLTGPHCIHRIVLLWIPAPRLIRNKIYLAVVVDHKHPADMSASRQSPSMDLYVYRATLALLEAAVNEWVRFKDGNAYRRRNLLIDQLPVTYVRWGTIEEYMTDCVPTKSRWFQLGPMHPGVVLAHTLHTVRNEKRESFLRSISDILEAELPIPVEAIVQEPSSEPFMLISHV